MWWHKATLGVRPIGVETILYYLYQFKNAKHYFYPPKRSYVAPGERNHNLKTAGSGGRTVFVQKLSLESI